ncbi:hypothetical protein TNCV_4650991 [Trichonephila clavipes]|nr:hypothetical protein TNCV_4650991 [Trichonephila clavipes]
MSVFLPDDRHTASLVGLRGGWRHARMKLFLPAYGSSSLPNNAMSLKSQFAIHKAIKEIGGEPKFVKRLRSGDLLVETTITTSNTIPSIS